MCGRYASARSVQDLASTFGISSGDVVDVPAADWNLAPTKPVPAVVDYDGRRLLTSLRWGLVPAWSDGVMNGASLFNARAETVADKPAFRAAVRERRCLLPADGWYEWVSREDGRRIPHFLSAADGSVLALAALWEEWRDGEGRPLRSTAVVTTAAREELRHVHDRSPVVLPRELWDRWLDMRTPLDEALAMLTTTAVAVRSWPVSDRVGDVRASGPGLAEPAAVDEQPALF